MLSSYTSVAGLLCTDYKPNLLLRTTVIYICFLHVETVKLDISEVTKPPFFPSSIAPLWCAQMSKHTLQVNIPGNGAFCFVNCPRLCNKNVNEFPRNCLSVHINCWAISDSKWEVNTILHTKNKMAVQKKPSWNSADLVEHRTLGEWRRKPPSPTRKLVGWGRHCSIHH